MDALAATWLVNGLVIFGLLILSLAVYGLARMPTAYTRLHAASKAAFFGIVPLLLAAATTGDPAIIVRAILIGVFLLLTTPVGAHAIGRAAYQSRERMVGQATDAAEESGDA